MPARGASRLDPHRRGAAAHFKAPVDRVQLSRYAGASGDFNPIHIDETYARALGMPSVYAPGMLVMGFLKPGLYGLGPRRPACRKYSVRFIKMVWPGDTVVCKGRVTDRHGDGGRYLVDVDLWAEPEGRARHARAGQRPALLFARGQTRQRSGQPPVVVDVPRESLLQQSAVQPSAAVASDEKPSLKAMAGVPLTTGSRARRQPRSRCPRRSPRRRRSASGNAGRHSTLTPDIRR